MPFGLPFGLLAPATFQRVVNLVLDGLIGLIYILYTWTTSEKEVSTSENSEEALNTIITGVAERMNRTLIEKAKCLMFDAGLPRSYWLIC